MSRATERKTKTVQPVQAPVELPEDIAFEEYLARPLPEDVTTETFLDPLSLGGLPGKGAGGHQEARAASQNMCFLLSFEVR